MLSNKKIKLFALLFSLSLLIIMINTNAASLPPADPSLGIIALSPPTVVSGAQTTVVFTSASGIGAQDSNAFIVMIPSTSAVVSSDPTGYWLDVASEVYQLPQCGASGVTQADPCIMAETVWSGTSPLTVSAVTSTNLLPNVPYYFIGVLDTALSGCGTGSPSCLQVPGCTPTSSEFCVNSNPPACNSYGGASTCGSSAPQVSPVYAGGTTLIESSSSVETLTVGPQDILPGASSDLNFLDTGVACNTESFLEISAKGQACAIPDTIATSPAKDNYGNNYINVFCNYDTSFLSPGSHQRYVNGQMQSVQINAYGTIDPWPPCVTNAAQVFNTFDVNNNLPTPYCELSYFTNSTYMPQGTYNICGSYQALAPNPNGDPTQQIPQGTPDIVNGQINVVTNALWGPSYGMYLTFGVPSFILGSSTAIPVTLNPQVSSDSPYLAYLASIGQPASQSSLPQICGGTGIGYNCYFELASADYQNGCISPMVLQGQNKYCRLSGTPELPCLLNPVLGSQPSSTAVIVPSQYMPQNQQGNYIVCAYDYFTPQTVSYNQFGSGSQLLQYPTNQLLGYDNLGRNPSLNYSSDSYMNNPPGAGDGTSLAIFFASASITCQNLSGFFQCIPGQSTEQQPTTFVESGPAQTAIGSVNINPLVITQGSTSAITANAYGISQALLSLYLVPDPSSLVDPKSVCGAALTTGSYQPCTGTATDANGCYVSYIPNILSPYLCSLKTPSSAGTSCGWGGSPDCQQYVPAGCTPDPKDKGYVDCPTPTGTSESQDPAGLQCSITGTSISTLPAGRYLYCLMYDNGYVNDGLLTINPSPSTIAASNAGTASTIPLNLSLCAVFSQIEAILAIFSITLLLLGAALYEAGQLLPTQARGTIQGYAMGMVLGGIVGAGLAAFSYTLVSLTVYGQLVNLLAACS